MEDKIQDSSIFCGTVESMESHSARVYLPPPSCPVCKPWRGYFENWDGVGRAVQSGSVNRILEGSASPSPAARRGRIRGILDADSRNLVGVLGT